MLQIRRTRRRLLIQALIHPAWLLNASSSSGWTSPALAHLSSSRVLCTHICNICDPTSTLMKTAILTAGTHKSGRGDLAITLDLEEHYSDFPFSAGGTSQTQTQAAGDLSLRVCSSVQGQGFRGVGGHVGLVRVNTSCHESPHKPRKIYMYGLGGGVNLI